MSKPFVNRYGTASSARFEFANTLTLQPGSVATLTNLGTAYAPILQFGVPTGLEGNIVSPDTLVVRGNIVLEGLLVSGKANVTGFSGGPMVTQNPWDEPANVHVIPWSLLSAGGSDEVSGVLTVHASAKDGSRKNGVASVSLVKNSGDPPDVMVFDQHASANLAVFDLDVAGDDLVVYTDDTCAVCWTFVAAV